MQRWVWAVWKGNIKKVVLETNPDYAPQHFPQHFDKFAAVACYGTILGKNYFWELFWQEPLLGLGCPALATMLSTGMPLFGWFTEI